MSTPNIDEYQVQQYGMYATAYHLEVNGSTVLLTGAGNTPEESISGTGSTAALTSMALLHC